MRTNTGAEQELAWPCEPNDGGDDDAEAIRDKSQMTSVRAAHTEVDPPTQVVNLIVVVISSRN